MFFSCLYVRFEARAGSPWFFLRGRDCGKALNYKGICAKESKHPDNGSGLLSFSRHGNESVEVECIPKHGDGHVDNVA